jgi:acetyltransferase
MLRRLTQLDYDRDMAFVLLREADGALVAVGRLSRDPDRSKAEYALLVRTDLQGKGLGWLLLQEIVAYARAERIGRVEGLVLEENAAMLKMCREFGFSVAPHPDEPGVAIVSLDLG